jgi:hypothetical protein
MPSSNYFGRWKENWDYLIATITAATANGQPLAGIQAVSRAEFPNVKLLPAIGCQFKDSNWSRYAPGQRHVVQHFAITACVQVEQSDAVFDTGDAAIGALIPFVNDGAGNGLEPLLNALGPLPGQWTRSMITELAFEVISDENQGANALAIARFLFATEDQVKGGG